MGEWLEVSEKTTDAAVTEACVRLGTTSDKIEYEVLEKESKGFLGFGSRPARIRARRKEETIQENFHTVQLMEQEKLPAESKQVKETTKKEEPEQDREIQIKKSETDYENRPAAKELFHNGKNGKYERRDNIRNVRSEESRNPYSASSFNTQTRNAARMEERPQTSMMQKEPVKIDNVEELKQDAQKFLQDIFDFMKMNAKMNLTFHEHETTLEIILEGEDIGILIGKRGQTLDSLQYLVSLVINRKSNSYVKVKLDTENYRERRKATLENLAKNIAFKVKRTKRAVTLEPMNPYERRIIHSALQYDKFVETHSEGEEPYRKVVITLKRNYHDYHNNHGGHRLNSGRGNYRRDYNGSYKRDYENYKKARQEEKEAAAKAQENQEI